MSDIREMLKVNLKSSGMKQKEFCEALQMPNSTYFKYLKKPRLFTSEHRKKISERLGLSVEELNQIIEQDNEKKHEKNEKILKNMTGRDSMLLHRGSMFVTWAIFVTAVVLSGAIGYFMKNKIDQKIVESFVPKYSNNSETETVYYDGNGKDIFIPNDLTEDKFHPSHYTYQFHNMKTEISGERITIHGVLVWTSIHQLDESSSGHFYAEGFFHKGKAALSYRVTDTPNIETWVGNAMLKMPGSGSAYGYWVTVHNDDDKSTQDVFERLDKFAFGSIVLDRKVM